MAYVGDERVGELKNDARFLSWVIFCRTDNTTCGKCFMLASTLTTGFLSLRS